MTEHAADPAHPGPTPDARPDTETVAHQRSMPVRYGLLWLGVLVCSLLTVPVAGFLGTDAGTDSPTVLLAGNPVVAVIALGLLVVVLTVIACFLARELNGAVALFVVGWGLGVLGLTTGGIDQFAWSGGSPWGLAIETLVWSVVIGVLVWTLMRFTGGLPDVPHDWRTEPVGSAASLLSKPSLLAAAAGAIVLPIAWLILVDTRLEGQALGAVVLGAFFAGMAGRAAAPRLDPILIYFSVVLFGGLAQVVAASGWSGSLPDALVAGDLPRFLHAMPLDWAAGSLIGVSMGVGWARSFITQDDEN